MTTNIKFSPKSRTSVINSLCRICGKEDKKCIPVFGEAGMKQGIYRKIRTCLPVSVEETDSLPKQICLECLSKLEASWELYILCKEGQLVIERKLQDLGYDDNEGQDTMCGVCNLEVHDNQLGVGCEGKCRRWHHCLCVNISSDEYYEMVNDVSRVWICSKCTQYAQTSLFVSMEDKIKCLSESNSITLGESAVICLAPPSPPPPTVPKAPVTQPMIAPVSSSSDTLMGTLPAPVAYIQPDTTDTVQQPTTGKDVVYPEGLIQVNQANKPVIYQQRSKPAPASVAAARQSVPKPMPSPATTTAKIPSPRRRALREGQSNNVPQPKRSHRMCTICNKSFPDDIIDHHFSLHMRRSFFTCLDCNKNFISEEAMSRHRCGDKTINLDPDDEPICL